MKGVLHQQDADADARRWSELFPPRTTLTFAAVWDPEEGMVTFSGAHLLESDSCDRVATHIADSPRDVFDTPSISIDMRTHTPRWAARKSATSPEDADLPADNDTIVASSFVPAWLAIPPGMSTGLNSPAFASSMALTTLVHEPETSTLCEEDPFCWVSAPPKRMPVRFDHSRSNSEETVTDEGFFEGRLSSGSVASLPVMVELNLSSAFSVTTTSTTRYVEVDFPPELEREWRRLGGDGHSGDDISSSWEPITGVDRAFCLNRVPQSKPSRRRLRKGKARTASESSLSSSSTPGSPAKPEEVLARQYNHVHPRGTPTKVKEEPPQTPTPPSSPIGLTRKRSIAKAKALVGRLGRCVIRDGDEESWVCIEVTQKVTHKVARDIL